MQITPALEGGGVETLTVDMATAVVVAGGRSLVASRGGRLEEALAWGGGELVRMPVDTRQPWTMMANASRLEDLIRAEKVSLVHVRSRAPAFSALWAARRTRTPLVATYHGIYPARTRAKRWYNSVMTRGDVVIANSTFTRSHILAEHGVAARKIEVIPEGVDIGTFDPILVSPERVARVRASWGVEAGDTVILVAARLAHWKGHRLAIAALARSAARKKAKLVFAGRGEESAYARQLAAAAAEAKVSLKIVGPCSDMPAAYLAADIVAAPSTEPESFGRSVAEAGAMARIVIATNLGGVAETVIDGETGLLAAAGDEAAWAAAFNRALKMSPDARAAMATAAWTRVRDCYSMAQMCETTFALYERLIEAKR
ncbi:MAG: glycosyltransferase [Caulobacteraceae bacterium]